jgi:hypothetical protein
MSHDSEKKRVSFFEPLAEERRAMNIALAEIVSAQQKAVLADFMLDENILHYKHGASWAYPANDFAKPGEMETISAEFTVPFQRIVDADMSLIRESIESITNQLSSTLTSKIYQTMSEACDRSGNVVREDDFAESILAAWEKIEFSVDVDGNVQLPRFHMHSDQIRKLDEQPAEFHEKIKEIKERKSEQARAKEHERKSKYKVSKL